MNVEDIIKTSSPLPVQRKTIIHLMLVGSRLTDALNQGVKPFDISLQQFNVLRILRGQKGKPANMQTLNERMVSKMSNTGRLVDKLLAKGYVDRQTCPSNRRKVEIRITDQGLELLAKVDPVIDRIENELTAGLNTKEFEQLNELLNKF